MWLPTRVYVRHHLTGRKLIIRAHRVHDKASPWHIGCGSWQHIVAHTNKSGFAWVHAVTQHDPHRASCGLDPSHVIDLICRFYALCSVPLKWWRICKTNQCTLGSQVKWKKKVEGKQKICSVWFHFQFERDGASKQINLVINKKNGIEWKNMKQQVWKKSE